MAGEVLLGRPKPARAARADERLRIAQHYWAFLSYSHKDTEDADWLHESLEDYRVPPALVGKLTDMGPVPKRLTPIFRDRHELAASGDLSDDIEEALAGSRFLIVLCSPAAAASHWTNSEIDRFKRRHPESCILAVILAGEPFASDMPGREEEECFPEALRTHYDRRGRPTEHRAEPIAADLREGRDGRKLGLLKIVAGMLGVGLDDLVQRETHRRHKRHRWITAVSVGGMLVTSGLAYTAIEARDEARDQRREADKLVGFMLGDLRGKLEPLGRLDLLDSVGAKALAYYESQDKTNLSDEALTQRSKALTLMGEMAAARGDLDGALARYREAKEGTAEAMRRTPDDPRKLFEHAQNVYWVGSIDYQRGDIDKAAGAFREYRRLADQMIALAPGNADYQRERVYADTNLGTVLWEQRRYAAAAEVYQQALEPIEALVAKAPADRETQLQLAGNLAWLADAREYSGRLDDALVHRQRQLDLLNRLWSANKGDTKIKRQEMAARRALSRLLASRGEMQPALDQSREASAVASWLIKTEPANTEWLQWAAVSNFERAALELAANRIDQARQVAAEACNASAMLRARDRSVTAWRTRLQLTCVKTNALIALRMNAPAEAINLSRQALVIARTEKDPVDRAFSIAAAETLLADALARTGQPDAARGAYERALAAWPAKVEERPREMADRAMLLRHLGRTAESRALKNRLNAMGYKHPDYQT